MMILIIIKCLYLCSVCKVFQVLKNAYFKEHLSVVAPKYSICYMENNSKEFKLCSMFKHSPNGKGKVYGPMEYSPNENDIMAPVEYNLMVYSPSGKDRTIMVTDEAVTAIVKDKKTPSITDLQYQSKLALCIT